MPLQNRVTPFGEIVAVSQRGLFTGNRGIIHDPVSRIFLNKRWATKTWLVCTCDYKNRRRPVMGGRSWTELFFLDEAVALAAGHRPCFLCRREAALRFRECWAAAKNGPRPSAAIIDAALHGERIERGRTRIHPASCPTEMLPDGTVVAVAGTAFTLRSGLAYRWAPEGYAPGQRLDHVDGPLTPPSTLGALVIGYRPVLHPSIESAFEEAPNAWSV